MASRRKVREPVQVYLEQRDKALLERTAHRLGLSQAEVLRRGLHRIASDLPGKAGPGASLEQLIGALAGADDVPGDLAARHDAFLYPAEREVDPRGG